VSPGGRARLVLGHLEVARSRARIFKVRTGDLFEVEDLISEAMVGLLQAASRWDGRGNFAAYAISRIDGAIKDFARHETPRQRQIEEAVARGDEAEDPVHRRRVDGERGERALVRVPAPGPGPDELVAEADSEARQRLEVKRLLAVLDERSAQVLRLHYLEGWTQLQIAQLLGVTASRVCQIERLAITKILDSQAEHDTRTPE
jgi:RNA polymerase sigma factor FliA